MITLDLFRPTCKKISIYCAGLPQLGLNRANMVIFDQNWLHKADRPLPGPGTLWNPAIGARRTGLLGDATP
jgi:hypothetical protein